MSVPGVLLAAALLSGSPASAALSCDDAALAKAALAALEQFKSSNSCGQDAALSRLNELFADGLPKGRVKAVLDAGDADPGAYPKPKAGAPAPEAAPITADVLDKAVADVSARLRDGTIKVACTRDDVSGYWDSHAVDGCPYSVCGRLEIGQRWIAKIQNEPYRTELQMRDADQVANTISHELTHLLVTYFRRVYGAADQATVPGGLREEFRYFTFFNGCSLQQVNGGAGREHAPIAYTAPSDMYDASRTGNEETARETAHAMQLCFNRKPNPYYAAILGDPRTDCSP